MGSKFIFHSGICGLNVSRILSSCYTFLSSYTTSASNTITGIGNHYLSTLVSPRVHRHYPSINDTQLRGTRFLNEVEVCDSQEASSPADVRLFNLDSGFVQRRFSALGIKQMGNSSIPNIYSDLTRFDEVAQNDILEDRRVLRRLLDAVASIWGAVRQGFVSTETLSILNDNFSKFGPTEPCLYLGNCYGDEIPSGRFHGMDSLSIMREVLREYFGRVDFYADEISTCWLTLEALLTSLDKVARYMEVHPEIPSIVVIPAGTGVASALDDSVNCNPYQSVIDRMQSLLNINNSSKIFVAAGTKPEILNTLGAALSATEFRDLLDISNSCLTPANARKNIKDVFAIAAVNSDGTCSEWTWPSLGNDNADFAYIPDPLGRHMVASDDNGVQSCAEAPETCINTSSGAVTHFAAKYAIYLLKVREFLPPAAENEMMDAVFQTLQLFPEGSDSSGCGAGIADLDRALEFLAERYGVSLPDITPSSEPTMETSPQPSVTPSGPLTSPPSLKPTLRPTLGPSDVPSADETPMPSSKPSLAPSNLKTRVPSDSPTTPEPRTQAPNLEAETPQREPTDSPDPDSSGGKSGKPYVALSSLPLLLSAFFALEMFRATPPGVTKPKTKTQKPI